ncbi:MAG TPA: gamma-glutamyltransferase, partial [Hyphomicrobiaceae bacterium]|nr:gamma-glutamyltransferase [Hyphomicrobiaceae bacterium]
MSIQTGRPVTLAPNGVVTSPHSLASAAGVDVLRAGGSAVDAAIATSAVLAVVYPHMTSIGGDAFWLIHEGKTGKIRFLDGGGRAAARGTIAAFEERGLAEVPFRGVLPATLTVPGAVASWAEAHAKFGRLPLKRNLEAATAYARDGFPVTARLAAFIRDTRSELAKSPEAAEIFLPGGDAPAAGQKITNRNLAATLDRLAAGGKEGF